MCIFLPCFLYQSFCIIPHLSFVSFFSFFFSLSLSLSIDNPLLLNHGPSTINLMHPSTTFTIGPVIAEYRTVAQGQRVATNELEVYYTIPGGMLSYSWYGNY